MAGLATTARDVALKDAKAAEERCRAAKAELKTLRDKQATRTRQLEEQVEKLKAREATVADRDVEQELVTREQASKRGRLDKLKGKWRRPRRPTPSSSPRTKLGWRPGRSSSPLLSRRTPRGAPPSTPAQHRRISMGVGTRSLW